MIGMSVGSFIPSLWGSSVFSISSVFFSLIGGFAGLWLGYKMAN